GWTVVVNGAAGNVGSAAVQLLLQQGARVIGTSSVEDHLHLARLGAMPVAYGDGVATRIRAVAPNGVDAVLDSGGHGFVATAIDLVGDPQRVLTIVDFESASLGIRASIGSRTPVASSFASILPLAARGAFAIRIGRIFPLAEMAAAHEAVAAG